MIMVDSGAFSIWNEMQKKGKILEGDELWAYCDRYAAFIKENIDQISVYVSVDIPFSPQLTWETQQYLEKVHNLHPMPVYHPDEDIKWLKKYIDNYDYVGLGALGASSVGKQTWVRNTADPAFNLICDTPDRLPRVKVHCFALASPELFCRYPFFSIDSASWVIYGKYGGVLIPKIIGNNTFDYTKPPWLIKTSWRNWHRFKEGTHIDNVSSIQRKEFLRYFSIQGFTLGKSEYKKVPQGYKLSENEKWLDKKTKTDIEIIIERGLCNDFQQRDDLNLIYFLDMEKSVPEYPWPWKIKTRRL